MWNRPPDFSPRATAPDRDIASGRFCVAGQSLNVTALAAELAARKFREAEAIRMTAEPRQIPKHLMTTRQITKKILRDPEPGRSAGDGWQQLGLDTPSEEWSEVAHGPWALTECFCRVPRRTPGKRSHSVATAVATLTGCRWPIGAMHDEDFHFCNEPRVTYSSYCAAHGDMSRARKCAPRVRRDLPRQDLFGQG